MLGDKLNPGTDPFIIQQGKIKDGQLKDVYRLSWTEETFSAGGRRGEVIGRSFNFSVLSRMMGIFLVFFGLLFARLAYLQVLEGDYYHKMADGNRIRKERLEARRGIIYDRNNKPLVHNVANFMLYVVPADLPKDEGEQYRIIRRIAEILAPLTPHQNFVDLSRDQNASSTKDILTKEMVEALAKIKPGTLERFQPLFITDDIPYEKALLLTLESANWKGVVVQSKTRREYQLPAESLSHLLGYTSKINSEELEAAGEEYLPIDYIGKNGLEYFYESQLRGKNGQKQIEVDALGKVKKVLSSMEADDGSDLILSIDVEMQKKLEELLRQQLESLDMRRGSAVVLNPQNGEILALVSLPAYDDNLFARGITSAEYKTLLEDKDRPLFNRSVAGEFPCGSTIKPVMVAAALNEGVVSENTTFMSRGGLKVGQWTFPDWKAGGHGVTDAKKAIAESVNTYFYIVGGGYEDFQGLGVDRIVRYDRLFGLGEQTGIDLPGEADGFVPTREWKEEKKGERWYVGDTYHLAIGQGDLTTTPLQVAQMTAYFANQGKLMTPHLVKAIGANNGEQREEREISVAKQDLVSQEVLQVVRSGMRQTVTQGSARSIDAVVPVKVAGKTGTAQWSTKKAPHAWFTGFAPFDNPDLVITILIEEGKEGSTAAVPVAREFLKWHYGPKVATSTATTSPTIKR